MPVDLLNCIYLLKQRLFNRLLDKQSLTLSAEQAHIMSVLWEEQPLLVSEIAKRTCLKTNTLSTMLNKLEAEGYIECKPCPKDARRKWVHLTQAGECLEKLQQQALSQLEQAMFANVDRTKLEQELKKVLDNQRQEDQR